MANKTSEAQIKASNKYNAKATKTVLVRLNLEKDKDIIERLGEQESMIGYLKRLIRRDMVIEPVRYPPTRYSAELCGCPLCKHEVKPEADSCEYCGVKLDWSK